VFCQLKAPIQRFTDIPADVRGKLQVSIGHGGAGLQQKVIDEAYTPYTGRYQKQPKDPAPKETPPTIFGDGIPSTPVVRESLRRLVFTITGSSASPLTPGTTTNINVGLVRDIDGNDMLGGVFRFTYFQVGKTPATVLIEHLGAGRQPPANYLADASKENFELAWKPRNFKLDGPGWELKERIGQLQWALVNAPQKALFTMFRDITFKYTAKPPGIKEDGLWDPATKTLTLFYGVFDSDAQRIGKMPYYAYVIVHELGHALESTFDTAGQAEFNAALKKDGGTPVTDYGRRNERESFAEAFAIFVMDQDQLTALRPSVADVFWKRYVR
jgi:hypothetical protein